MKNKNDILVLVCFSGRYYIKKMLPIYTELEKEKLIQVVTDGDKNYLVPNQSCFNWIRQTKSIPPQPDTLSEEGFLIIRTIVNLLRSNNKFTQTGLWDAVLKHYPGKYKTIREAMYYYNLSQVKSAL